MNSHKNSHKSVAKKAKHKKQFLKIIRVSSSTNIRNYYQEVNNQAAKLANLPYVFKVAGSLKFRSRHLVHNIQLTIKKEKTRLNKVDK